MDIPLPTITFACQSQNHVADLLPLQTYYLPITLKPFFPRLSAKLIKYTISDRDNIQY